MLRVAFYTVSRHVLAAVMVGLTTGLLLLFRRWVTTPTVALLYLLPVGLSTAFWGLGSGLVGGLGAFVAFNYFFLPPYFTLHVLRAEDIVVQAAHQFADLGMREETQRHSLQMREQR